MLNVQYLFKSYGTTTALDDVSFGLRRGDRAGLVGANGSGKSTLLKILAGAETADSGKIIFAPSTQVGYLPQAAVDAPGETVDAVLMRAAGRIRELDSRMVELEAAMSTASPETLKILVDEYSEVSGQFDEAKGYTAGHRIERVMHGIGLGSLERSRLIGSLSGGEKTRLGLAVVLLGSPDLLLLDEPTNNLDFDSLRWLEAYLAEHRGSMIVASHDREFLNNTANIILEIDEHNHRLKKYPGNYDMYKVSKEIERDAWEEDYRNQQEEMNQLRATINSGRRTPKRQGKPADADKFVAYFKGQRVQASASRTIRNAAERLKRIEKDPIPKPPKPLRFKPNVKLRTIRSAQVLSAEAIRKSFGMRSILSGVRFALTYDSRVVITGPNGSGKSTLLHILVGKERAGSGVVTYAPNARIGFLPQEPDLQDADDSVLDSFRRGLVGLEEDFVFDLVTCGLFRYEELKKRVADLSLGQKRKLQIARLIAEGPNVLILDEPTNHLSLDVLESFESALAAFQGPILAVSHDRRFIQRFGRQIWEITDGRLSK